jgi:hypothetical protein
MADNVYLTEARAALPSCLPKNGAKECILEDVADNINPPDGAAPSPDSLDKLIEALPPESLVKP